MIDFQVDLPDFNRQLQALKLEFQTKTVKAAVRAAGGVMRDQARLRAPVLSTPNKQRVVGALKRNIYIGIPRRQVPGQVRGVVSVRSGRKRQRGGDPFYWRFLEGGWIPRGPGNRLTGGRRTKALARSRGAGRRVKFPYLRPAFESSGHLAIDAFNKKMAETLKRFSA